VAIKYLTQSTWSHAALFVGGHGDGRLADVTHCFVEADLLGGVHSVGVAAFAGMATRICRPVGLNEEERRAVGHEKAMHDYLLLVGRCGLPVIDALLRLRPPSQRLRTNTLSVDRSNRSNRLITAS
jgi:hypothetical protein